MTGPDLRQLRVLILHPRDADGSMILRELQRAGCRAELTWPPAPLEGADADVVIAVLTREIWAALPRDDARAPATIAIVERGAQGALRLVEEAAPHAVLVKPFEPSAILTNLAAARHTQRYQQRLLVKLAKLEETLRSMRRVEQAKTILMKERKIDEPQAYAFLRKQAMAKRMPIGAIASAVIDSTEALAEND